MARGRRRSAKYYKYSVATIYLTKEEKKYVVARAKQEKVTINTLFRESVGIHVEKPRGYNMQKERAPDSYGPHRKMGQMKERITYLESRMIKAGLWNPLTDYWNIT